MTKKFVLIFGFAVTLGFSIVVADADDGWVTVASTNDGSLWQAKLGSLEFTQTKGGDPIAIVIGRFTTTTFKKISLEKWYVKLADCVNAHGTIVTLNMSGEFLYENDFVFGGGNVASGMAELICGAARQVVIDAENKGI